MIKRTFFLILSCCLLTTNIIKADEGMWLPLMMTEKNYQAMEKRGFRLTPEDLYSINNASLKDAIVLFGRGCSGELVSDKGMILTNHHCGFSRIQSHSSPENDYLLNGFWAADLTEELPNKGLTASILVRMEDVTDRVKSYLNHDMTESQRNNAINDISDIIVEEAIKGTHYAGEVKPIFHGNQFILVITEVFKDVRLVGAPPTTIGKFGGDMDNWVWPRHTGDFAIFRIYADKDNKPAEYSEDNVPYKPRKFLEISAKGINEGDFTMVYGFPFRTQQYLPSFAIEMYQNHIFPIAVNVRDHELDVINDAMASSDELRIMYSARQASVANAWKRNKGIIPGLKRFKVIEKKQNEETDRMTALENDTQMQSLYKEILESYEKAYSELLPHYVYQSYFNECFWKQSFFRFIFKAYRLTALDLNTETGVENAVKTFNEIKNAIPGFYKSIDIDTERKIMTALIEVFIDNIPDEKLPARLLRAKNRFNGNYERYVSRLFNRSFFSSEEDAAKFFSSWKRSSYRKLNRDPLFSLMKEIIDNYRFHLMPALNSINPTIDSLHRINMRVIMDLEENELLYPDANATLRISYGQIEGSYPRDGVKYHYQTTLDGVFMKEDPNIPDYTVPEKLREIYENKDFGKYEVDGTVPVAFIASNHTTGGNSGSPVLNADGHLIGINFDRAWEGTMSDMNFEPSICRNISIDIRYLLFIVDKYAEASHLLEEMTIHR